MGRLGRGLLLAPLVFVAHWLEESPGFVSWFNAHVTRGVTQETFWNVNAAGLVITILVVLAYWATRSTASALLVVVLYVPYFVWVVLQVVRTNRVALAPVVAAAILGGLPMAVHGYLILFRGSRLFQA